MAVNSFPARPSLSRSLCSPCRVPAGGRLTGSEQFQVKFSDSVLQLGLCVEGSQVQVWAEIRLLVLLELHSSCQKARTLSSWRCALKMPSVGLSQSASCSESSPVGSKAVASRSEPSASTERRGEGLDSGHFLIKSSSPFRLISKSCFVFVRPEQATPSLIRLASMVNVRRERFGLVF